MTILDTWYSIGLQGSGSNEVKDLFIPHMIITAKDLLGGDLAGRATNPGALFRPPVYMTVGILLTSTAIGMAEGMLAEYLAQSRKAIAIMSAKDIGIFQAQQIKLGEATAALHGAQALIRAEAREIQTLAAADQPPDSATRSKYRSNAAYAGGLAYRAAQRIFDLAGARAIYANNEIGRIFLHVIVATAKRGHQYRRARPCPPQHAADQSFALVIQAVAPRR